MLYVLSISWKEYWKLAVSIFVLGFGFAETTHIPNNDLAYLFYLLYPISQLVIFGLLGRFLKQSLTFGEAMLISFIACMFWNDFLNICFNGFITQKVSTEFKIFNSIGLIFG